jgi:hypothetical protein
MADVEGHAAGPDDLARGRRIGAQPGPDPGDQLSQGERLGQVVLRAQFEHFDLGGDVGDARQHDDRLPRPDGDQLAQGLPAADPRHHQVEDDEVVVVLQDGAQGHGAVVREVSLVAGRVERPAYERADLGFVIGDENAPERCHLAPAASVLSRWPA